MELLQNSLKRRISELPEAEKEIRDRLGDELLDRLYSVYPFNRFEYIISHLIATRTISLPEYLDLRNDYMQRNKSFAGSQTRKRRAFDRKSSFQRFGRRVRYEFPTDQTGLLRCIRVDRRMARQNQVLGSIQR
mgnify:CR=1 FL=1